MFQVNWIADWTISRSQHKEKNLMEMKQTGDRFAIETASVSVYCRRCVPSFVSNETVVDAIPSERQTGKLLKGRETRKTSS